jgi:hypothetical protein
MRLTCKKETRRFNKTGCTKSTDYESWTMKKEDVNILRRFERKIIRRIYGPVRQWMEWRIRNNEEIDNIVRKKI